MSNVNWMRRVLLKCGPKGGSGIQVGNIDSATQDGLHIAFSVEKSNSETANTAKVQVWNLSTSSLNILSQPNGLLELRAGYADNVALILTGNIETVTTTADNADRLTEIEVTDGGVALRDVVICVSYNGKTSCDTVYRYIAGQMGMSIVYGAGVESSGFKVLPNGFAYVGTAANAMTKLASLCGHSWSVQNGVLQVTKSGASSGQYAYVLSAETGLIGIPKKITITSGSDSSTSQTGYEIQYLLNGAIGVNDFVRLESNEVTGDFYVYKVTFDGDNVSGDWMCTAQVLKAT